MLVSMLVYTSLLQRNNWNWMNDEIKWMKSSEWKWVKWYEMKSNEWLNEIIEVNWMNDLNLKSTMNKMKLF